MAPFPKTQHKLPLNNNKKVNNSISTKELQWGDDLNDKVWETSAEGNPETSASALDLPFIEGTQILCTSQTQTDSNKNDRLSMDADQFKTTKKTLKSYLAQNQRYPKKQHKQTNRYNKKHHKTSRVNKKNKIQCWLQQENITKTKSHSQTTL